MKKIMLSLFACLCISAQLIAQVKVQKGWKPLFGSNLEHAVYNAAVWSEKDGVLSAVEDESIWTNSEYENFELDLEFKTDVGTNSGVVIYCTDTKNWIPNSVEIQIADDYCDKWANGDKFAQCGAIYGHLAANKQQVVKKPGEWNHMRIRCIGQNISVILNGKKVTQMDMSKWTSGSENPDGSKIPSWLPTPFAEMPTKGYIGLQGKHGDALIWFRNVNVKDLNKN